jgi:DNA repair exonuclease SbcCD ATPase subunit
MRPHKLTISGFLSYGGEEVIDFDSLASSGGLFLIHGRTGAGKTSILDAISYALYGKLPKSRDAVASTYRSDFAAPSTPTFVELELTLRGKRIQVRRNPDYVIPPDGENRIKKVKGATKANIFENGDPLPKPPAVFLIVGEKLYRLIEELLPELAKSY